MVRHHRPDFIAKAFQFAREADPDAILRYNDYGLENPEKRTKLNQADSRHAREQDSDRCDRLSSALQRIDNV